MAFLQVSATFYGVPAQKPTAAGIPILWLSTDSLLTSKPKEHRQQRFPSRPLELADSVNPNEPVVALSCGPLPFCNPTPMRTLDLMLVIPPFVCVPPSFALLCCSRD
ncbi:unnamed protein product [Protopolystoma xenopodis]|uniref:Uncharacterized protein n=1 Tax=Protopolystoma xenopodis TaxID=117903 RepID=A0A448XGM9_9PLAT|nr:unnamed protein product [Protopolystoma xenopodis]